MARGRRPLEGTALLVQIRIAVSGIVLLLAAAMGGLVGIAWIALVGARRLPLVGRRGRRD
jgi:hypothetical protein